MMRAVEVEPGDRVRFTAGDGRKVEITVRKVRYGSVTLVGDDNVAYQLMGMENVERVEAGA